MSEPRTAKGKRHEAAALLAKAASKTRQATLLLGEADEQERLERQPAARKQPNTYPGGYTETQALDQLAEFLYADAETFPSGADTCEELDRILRATGRDPQRPKRHGIVSVTIELGNAAMLDGFDAQDAVRTVAHQLGELGAEPHSEAALRDANGNTIGGWLCRLPLPEHYPGKRYTLEELEALPTLAEGQADDLKVDTGTERISLSRCGIEDGEPFDNAVTVEQLQDGRWVETDRYEAERS